MTGLVVDLFAGGGGASVGLEAALGRDVDLAINHDAVAIAVHKANHPRTVHLAEDIWHVDPLEATGGAPVDVLWASPDCTHFSVAKGGKPRKKKIRSLAWRVVDWARAVKPKVIFIENVAEFRGWGPLDRQGHPIKAKKGFEFRRWKRSLERAGYEVDYRVLDASLYGAPTKRRRLFLVARCDGRSIVWPDPTHGPGRLPVHTAAECIDWSIPCPSIFDRKRPLAEKTMWRIFQGLVRFVIESPDPFIVGVGGRAGQSQPTSIENPVGTVTAKNDRGLVVPVIAKFRHDSVGASADQPLPTITAGGQQRPSRPATGNPLGLIAPTLVEMNHSNAPRTIDDPLGVVTTQGNRFNLVAPHLVKVNHGKNEARGESIEKPLSTVTATQRGHAIVAPTLVQTGYGERKGQAPRVLDLHQPIGTLVDGQKHALCSAFLAKHYGDTGQRPGSDLREPVATITANDHNAPVAATLIRLNHDDHGVDLTEPMPSTLAQGNHIAEVRAFLTTWFGSDGNPGKGQSLDQPMRTITARHRHGLVVAKSGATYQIVDIGMRMLQPHELLRAQFGRFSEGYDLSAATTKSDQVRLIGNSVCPEIAEAIVRANVEIQAMEATA